MRHFAITVTMVGGLVAALFTTAMPADAAPSNVGTAQDTVNQLHANGYRVILGRFGTAPLTNCSVTAVRPGRAITTTVTDGGGDMVENILYTTVYVDVAC